GGAGVLVSGYQSYNFEDTAPQFFSPRRADDSSMQSVATLSSLWSPPSVSVASNQVVHCTYLGRVWPIAGIGGGLLGGPVGWMSLVVDAGLIHLSLGPSVDVGEDTYYLPVAWVQDSIPVLSQSGSYYRFVMGSFVAFALGVGAGLNTISRYSTFLAVGMGGLLIRNAWVETEKMKGHPIPLTAQTAFSSPEIAKLRGGEGAVLGLPLLKNMGCDKGSFGYVKEYWLHRRPILHSMEPPIRYRSNEPKIGRLQRAFISADCAKKMPAVLSSLNVGSLIVQLNARCPLSTEQLRCLEDAFGSATRGKEVLLWETLN
ncbi:MAG: hypothetical protein VX278_17795, partial [Myxococcota bacterium]|nr:hypothetical protein [Myxococcota bacterium]